MLHQLHPLVHQQVRATVAMCRLTRQLSQTWAPSMQVPAAIGTALTLAAAAATTAGKRLSCWPAALETPRLG